MTTILKIDPTEYGLEETKATEIANQFSPMLKKMVELEKEFNEVIQLPIEQPETAKAAKELRLKYVKVRTGTAEIHKQQKAFYLAGGRFVDGWKNAQLFASQNAEQKLEAIENYLINIEKEKIKAKQDERAAIISQYGVDGTQIELGKMTDDFWDKYLSGTKLHYEQEQKRIKEIEAAQESAKEAERTHYLRKEKLTPFWNFLPNEIKSITNLSEINPEEFEIILTDAKSKSAIEDQKIEAIKKENQRLADEKKALENEIEKKMLAEIKAQQDEEARIQAELSKGDKLKLLDLIKDLDQLKNKYQFKAKKYMKIQKEVAILLDKIITHINH